MLGLRSIQIVQLPGTYFVISVTQPLAQLNVDNSQIINIEFGDFWRENLTSLIRQPQKYLQCAFGIAIQRKSNLSHKFPTCNIITTDVEHL